jgi:hypothetical protein
MKTFLAASFVLGALAVSLPCTAQGVPELPKPEKEHQWLDRLVGEWDTEAEIHMMPGQPPLKTKGTETTRKIGNFWTIAEVRSEFMDQPFNAVLTLGYEAERKKYVGTWVDSMMPYLWNYTGDVDPTGNILTLETRGPCPKRPGELSNFKEVIELKGDDQRVFTSSMQEEDGSWTKLMTVNYRRKE